MSARRPSAWASAALYRRDCARCSRTVRISSVIPISATPPIGTPELVAGSAGAHTWTAGAALSRDEYASRTLPGFDFTHLTPSLFAQDEVAIGARVVLSGTARLDVEDLDRTILSPLVAALFRPGGRTTLRLAAGAGYAPGVPFTEETAVVGLWRVAPPADLRPERAATASLDLGWSDHGLELDGSLFASRVEDIVRAAERAGDRRKAPSSSPANLPR